MKITNIYAIEILDSRGLPTIEVHIESNNHSVFASAPSGASTGSLEANELRDNDLKRFKGKGVQVAVKLINEKIAKDLIGKDFENLSDFDDYLIHLDKNENKKEIGGNTTIASSIAFTKLKALNENKPTWKIISDEFKKNNKVTLEDHLLETLPAPMMNIINGGKHADNDINIQEFMIMPVGAETFSQAIEIGGNIFHTLRDILKKNNLSINVGDEGGFAPNLKSTEEALEFLINSIEKAGYKAGKEVLIALDSAASEFYNSNTNQYLLTSNGKELSSDEMIDFYESLVKNYPIFSIEDPLSEYDLDGLLKMTNQMKNKIQIVGDDIFVTNLKILKERENLCNAILTKPNQIGTVTETINTISYANSKNFNCIASHRSGETEESFISDFAFGSFCNQIKVGSLCRTDRTCKYNQLLRIEDYLNRNHIKSTFQGKFILEKFNNFRK